MSIIYFVDTETGGLDPLQHSIFSVAIVRWEDGKIEKIYESPLIKEEKLCYTKQALEINKIEIEDIIHNGFSPGFVVNEIIREFRYEKEHILGGHNVAFDVGFIKRLFHICNRDRNYPFSYRTVDTVSVARFLAHCGIINTDMFNMKNLCDYFGIEVKGYHTALGDALATAELYNKMLEKVTIEVLS